MLGLIISLIVIGLIAGALARLIIPGKQNLSILMTILLGFIGSFVGGFLGFVIFQHDPMDGFFQPARIIGSVIGAVILLFIWTRFEPEDECYDVCSNAWSMFVNGSLKTFIETGEGKPYSFDGDEALTGADHAELHHQAAEAAGLAKNAS